MSKKIFPSSPILFVDDEEHFLLSAELTMSSGGMNNIETCRDSQVVMDLLSKKDYSLVVLDINMPYLSGLDLLPAIVNKYPETPVIVLTAVNDVDSAVFCMKEGAFDYLVKPVSDTRLVSSIKRGLEITQIKNENEMLKQSLLRQKVEYPEAFKEIVTRCNTIESIFKYIEAIAKTNLPVLITGETGVGKELFAKAIHLVSGRKGILFRLMLPVLMIISFPIRYSAIRRGLSAGLIWRERGLLKKRMTVHYFLMK